MRSMSAVHRTREPHERAQEQSGRVATETTPHFSSRQKLAPKDLDTVRLSPT
jgi:hypothetical protein